MSSQDGLTYVEHMGGEAFRVSACCLAEVRNVHERTHPENDWWSSHFVCSTCDTECQTETNQRVVELRQELRDLKAANGE